MLENQYQQSAKAQKLHARATPRFAKKGVEEQRTELVTESEKNKGRIKVATIVDM